jgi:hypothetical protein
MDSTVGGAFRDNLKSGVKGPLMVVLPPGRFQLGSGLKGNEKKAPSSPLPNSLQSANTR